jgi:predicted ATPase with chaperone activity
VLETLREPLEAGRITISRAALQADFPAACQLIAAEPLSVRLARGSERPLPLHA